MAYVGLCWFTVARTRQLVDDRSAIQLQPSGLGAFFFFFFFFTLEHRRFRSFPCLRDILKTIFWALAFIEVPLQLWKAQQTLPLLLIQVFRIFLATFPSKRTLVKTAAALHFLMVSMKTSSRTDENE